MDEIKTVLKENFKLFPLLQFNDIYKLLYQACYGPKHMSLSKEKIYESIYEEAKNNKPSLQKPIYIGNGFYRVFLNNDEEFITKLSDAFYKSIQLKIEELNIEEVLVENQALISDFLKISYEEFNKSFNDLKTKKFPAISHSNVYKKAYDPHYRVIHKSFMQF